MTTERDEMLKPCPFCGGDARLIDGTDVDVGHFVRCEYCRLDYPNGKLNSAEKAIAVWNDRAATPPSPAPLPLAVRLRDEEGPPLPQMIAQRRAALAAPAPLATAREGRPHFTKEQANYDDGFEAGRRFERQNWQEEERPAVARAIFGDGWKACANLGPYVQAVVNELNDARELIEVWDRTNPDLAEKWRDLIEQGKSDATQPQQADGE